MHGRKVHIRQVQCQQHDIHCPLMQANGMLALLTLNEVNTALPRGVNVGKAVRMWFAVQPVTAVTLL